MNYGSICNEDKITNEVWRDIDGYEGLYQISNLGRIKSLPKKTKQKTTFLRPGVNSVGYANVVLHKNGEKHNYKVHRLVARAFIPNSEDLPCINHKDENKLNNNVSNLEWCSVKYNTNYGSGMRRNAEKQIATKATRKPIFMIDGNNNITWFQSIRDCQRITGLCQTHISKVIRGIYRQYNGFRFELAGEQI